MVKQMTIVITAFAILVFAYPASAQQAEKIHRIGILAVPALSKQFNVFRHALGQLGYIEGRNLVIEYRSAEGRTSRLPALAANLVALDVDLLVTHTTPGVRAAKKATRTIPIVMAMVGNAIKSGLVESLARPGGNVTGNSFFGAEINAKRVELLKDILPSLSRMAMLLHPSHPEAGRRAPLSVARSLGIEVQLHFVKRPEDFERVFAAMKRQRAEAMFVFASPITTANRSTVIELAARYRLPAIYPWRNFTRVGGLISYGPDRGALYRRAATYVDKILKGAKPAELPVERPTKFDLVINLKTAKALGITIPRSILLRATDVIE